MILHFASAVRKPHKERANGKAHITTDVSVSSHCFLPVRLVTHMALSVLFFTLHNHLIYVNFSNTFKTFIKC